MKQKVEIFSAGCCVCDETIEQVKRLSCDTCDICICDTRDKEVAKRAKELGINRVPAIVVDGKLLDCCKCKPISDAELRACGIGK